MLNYQRTRTQHTEGGDIIMTTDLDYPYPTAASREGQSSLKPLGQQVVDDRETNSFLVLSSRAGIERSLRR